MPSASTAPSATPVVTMDPAADAGLLATAAKAAPGMQPDGQVTRADLKEGEHTVQLVTLQPGRCYTVVGFSPAGQIKDLDLHLLAPPFYVTSGGDDTTADNAPVIGKAPSPICPLSPIPLAYKLDVHAKKGAGKIAVQLFSKAK
jgi:hypothetical protein